MEKVDIASLLPSYSEAVESASDNNKTLPPTILVLAGQSIHAATDPTAVLYELNRGVATLGPATSEVTLERLERIVNATTAHVKVRKRHIYTLRCSRPVMGIREPNTAEYYVQAVSKEASGHAGFKQARTGFLRQKRQNLVLLVNLASSSKADMPPFVDQARPLYEVRHQNGVYKWMARPGGGKTGKTEKTERAETEVAVEYDADDDHRLVIMEALPRKKADLLVAIWCSRMWQTSVKHHKNVVPRELTTPELQFNHSFR